MKHTSSSPFFIRYGCPHSCVKEKLGAQSLHLVRANANNILLITFCTCTHSKSHTTPSAVVAPCICPFVSTFIFLFFIFTMYLTLISLLAHWWPWQAPPARTAAATPVPPPRIALQAGLTHVVLLGEGNFSFSLALCRLLWPSGGSSARPAKPQLARSDPDSYSEAGDDDAS